MNQARHTILLRFLAQVAHIHFDNVTFTTKIIIPNAIKNNFAGKHLTGMAQEEFEQLIRTRQGLELAVMVGVTLVGLVLARSFFRVTGGR